MVASTNKPKNKKKTKKTQKPKKKQPKKQKKKTIKELHIEEDRGKKSLHKLKRLESKR